MDDLDIEIITSKANSIFEKDFPLIKHYLDTLQVEYVLAALKYYGWLRKKAKSIKVT